MQIESHQSPRASSETAQIRGMRLSFGHMPFCSALFSLRDLTAQRLEKETAALVDKLRGEYTKLDAALRQKVQEVRRG